MNILSAGLNSLNISHNDQHYGTTKNNLRRYDQVSVSSIVLDGVILEFIKTS